MVDFLLQVALQTWWILKEASIFLLLGFALAGVLGVLVPARTMLRFLGTGKVKSALWGSAIGLPLPLCSCGVLPTALGLRRQGATKAATVSFLISTPETGVDSISLSYALMDPIITVFRPVVAMVTAITAGLATNFFGDSRRRGDAPRDQTAHGEDKAAASELECGHDHGRALRATSGPPARRRSGRRRGDAALAADGPGRLSLCLSRAARRDQLLADARHRPVRLDRRSATARRLRALPD